MFAVYVIVRCLSQFGTTTNVRRNDKVLDNCVEWIHASNLVAFKCVSRSKNINPTLETNKQLGNKI